MNLFLVFPLIFAFLSGGHSHMEIHSNSCHTKCPPGYHAVCDSPENPPKHTCKKCDANTYTEIENNLKGCIRCDACKHYEVEIKPCNFTSNVVCDCKKGYYNANPNNSTERQCKPCKAPVNHPDYKRKCQPYQRECHDVECLRNCTTKNITKILSTTTTTSTTTATTTSTTTSTAIFKNTTTVQGTTTRRMSPKTTSNPVINTFPPGGVNRIHLLVWMVVILAVVFGLLLLRTLLEKTDNCPCWTAKKDVEQHAENPKFNEQHSHQDTISATLTLKLSEETPMMILSQSPSTPDHPAHISPLLPNGEHKAARQDDESKHWPAIVLYAIIKEVPLRRWKEFLRLLSVADEQLERAELEAGLGLGSIERQYQMLRLWSQRSSASLNDVFSALHYMDLSGCAQLLQENLQKLQWRAESKQCFTACRNYTDHGFSGTMQDT